MKTNYEFKSNFNEKHNIVTRKMLRVLSEYSRTSISELSNKIKMSRISVRRRLKKLEKEFDIKYTVELNETLLKLVSQHLIVVKFESKPDYKKIVELLQQSYIPQFAVSMKGYYDLIIYATSTSSKEYAHWDKSMQIFLSKYGADWKSSEVVHQQLGFFPLRNEIIDEVNISKEDKELLKMLNSNSRINFRQLSRQLKRHFNTIAYRFNKLIKSGYIKRFTITIDKPKDVSFMSFFAKYKPKDGYENTSATARKAFMSDDDQSFISRYIICAPLIGSYDFFTLGAFDNSKIAYKNDILYHKNLFKKHGIKLVYSEVDRVIFGRLPIRSIETKKEYNKIIWDAHLQKI